MKLKEPEKIIISTQVIATRFFIPGCESEVNVSDNMKKKIVKLVESSTKTAQETVDALQVCLLRAQNEILTLMALGTYPRFLKSKYYTEWLSCKDEEARKVETTGRR